MLAAWASGGVADAGAAAPATRLCRPRTLAAGCPTRSPAGADRALPGSARRAAPPRVRRPGARGEEAPARPRGTHRRAGAARLRAAAGEELGLPGAARADRRRF